MRLGFREAMMSRLMDGQRGITLLSALVLVVILAALFFLARPFFVRAWQRSHQAACVYHLSLIGKAVQQYASDNGDIVPPAQWCWGTSAGDVVRWDQALASFLPARERDSAFQCPSKKSARIGYAVNYRTFRNNQNPKAVKQNYARTGEVRSAGDTIYALDTGKVTAATRDLGSEQWKEEAGDASPICRATRADEFYRDDPMRPMPRHGGRVNCLMLDGGVRDFTVDEIVTPKEGSKECLWDAR